MNEEEQTPEQEDPMLRLRYYRETGQAKEAALYERYLRETGQWKEPPAAAAKPKVPFLEGIARSGLAGATGGILQKPSAAISAGLKQITGQGKGSLGETYESELGSERERAREFEGRHPMASLVSETVGGVAPALVTMGGSSAATQTPTLFHQMLKGGAINSAQASGASLINEDGTFGERAEKATTAGRIGGAVGFGLPVPLTAIGMIGGRILSPATNAASKALGNIEPNNAVSRAAERVSPVLGELARRGSERLKKLGGTFGPSLRANRELIDANQRDVDAGARPLPSHPEVPRIGLDELAGPEGVGLARRVLMEPGGTGRPTLTQAITERENQRQGKVAEMFGRLTGTTRASGEAVAGKLATGKRKLAERVEQIKLANANRMRPAAPPKPADPDMVAEFKRVAGGDDNEGLAHLDRLIKERGEDANTYFDYARGVANGPIESESLDAVVQTPTGRAALAWALGQKADRMRALPSETRVLRMSSEEYAGVKTADWERQMANARARGMAEPELPILSSEEKQAIDPETIHYMKQWLTKQGRLGVNDGAGGMIATKADAAARLMDRVRDELPEAWREADAVFAKHSKKIDAFNLGREVMRAQVNPKGTKGAKQQSLYEMQKRVAAMTPEEQQNYRKGARYAIETHLATKADASSGSGQARLSQSAQRPGSTMSQRIELATGRPDVAAQFGLSIAPSAKPVQPPKPAAQPLPKLGSEETAIARGLNIGSHEVAPPHDQPDLSLSEYGKYKATLPPNEQESMREGAAHSFRSAIEGAKDKPLSVENVFDRSNTRREQIGHAFNDPDKLADWESFIDAAEGARKRGYAAMGGSPTETNRAQRDTGGDLLNQAEKKGTTWKALFGMLNAGDRRRVNDALGDIFASSQAGTISRAQAAVDARTAFNNVLTQAAAAAGTRRLQDR